MQWLSYLGGEAMKPLEEITGLLISLIRFLALSVRSWMVKKGQFWFLERLGSHISEEKDPKGTMMLRYNSVHAVIRPQIK